MTSETARQHLEAADQDLNTALDQLVAMQPGIAQLPARLQEIAERLKQVSAGRSSFQHSASMQASLGTIQACAARVQLLLDAAANFYCGSLSTAVSHSGAYTSEGELARRIDSGYLKLEA